MNIRPISVDEFNNFVKSHPLRNYYQSIHYAKLQAEYGYDFELIGYTENSSILAAALILTKKIKNITYGYAPRGFLIDYSNLYFLKNFTDQLKNYYKKKGIAFIKINPEIAIGKLNYQTKNIEYNSNYYIVNNLITCGYKKLKNNLYFESVLPRFMTVLPLQNFDIKNLQKNTRNKIKKGLRKGLTLELVDKYSIDTFYNLIKNKISKNNYYYMDKYNVFSEDENVDLFLVSINYKDFLLNSQKAYEEELNKNAILNEKISHNNKANLVNRKMSSDRLILTYKNEITEAGQKINDSNKEYIATALVIKYDNRIKIDIAGFDSKYKNFAPNYFLYYKILDYYKDKYKYAELNGVSGDFNKDSKYYGLTRFKMGFKADIYEYIGEFDLPIDNIKYDFLIKSGRMIKEFNKNAEIN